MIPIIIKKDDIYGPGNSNFKGGFADEVQTCV